MSTVAQVITAASSFRESTKDRRRTSVRDDGPSTGEITYWVKTSQLSAALAIIDGVNETIIISVGPPAVSVVRRVPLQHQQFSNMFAIGYDLEDYFSSEAAVTGVSGTGPQTKVVVKFSTPEWPYGETTYTRVSSRGFPHTIPTHPLAAAFSGGPLGFDLKPPIFGSTTTLSVSDASGVTEANEAAWVNAAGKVNSATFRGHAAGTILVGAPSFDYRVRKDGSVACDYALELSRLPIRWDAAYQANGTLGTVLIGGAPMFSTVDIASLII